MRVNWGKFLQQWAYAARCETVAWVRRISEMVGTCLAGWPVSHVSAWTADSKENRGRDALLQLSELLGIERLIPANVHQHFDPPIELQELLRCGRLREGPLQGAEVEHGCLGWQSLPWEHFRNQQSRENAAE